MGHSTKILFATILYILAIYIILPIKFSLTPQGYDESVCGGGELILNGSKVMNDSIINILIAAKRILVESHTLLVFAGCIQLAV